MGFLDSFFKPKIDSYSANERKVILMAEAQCYSRDIAEERTEDLLQKQDLSGDRILQVPDGIILNYSKIVSENLANAKKQNISLDLDKGKQLTFEHIERNRNATLGMPETNNIPRTPDDNIHFRVRREVEFIYKTNPETLGFTHETLQIMIKVVKEVYQPNMKFQL